MKASKVGKIRSCVTECHERKFKITFGKDKFVPELWINVFRVK
jgi:hypothetical protein